jgi:hypothetical protein
MPRGASGRGSRSRQAGCQHHHGTRTPHMKRPCQAFAGRRVVDHLMSRFDGCFCARSACPPGGGGSGGMGACGRRWPGRAAGPAWACPRFPARGAAVVSGVQAGPQGRRRRRCAAALTLEGRPRSLPARPADQPRTVAAAAGGGGAPGRDGGGVRHCEPHMRVSGSQVGVPQGGAPH